MTPLPRPPFPPPPALRPFFAVFFPSSPAVFFPPTPATYIFIIMSINDQIADIIKRLDDGANKSEDNMEKLSNLILSVSNKAKTNYSSMMLALEQAKDQQAAATRDVSGRVTSQAAVITDLTEKVNASTSAHINTNRRIEGLDVQHRLSGQLNSLDALINNTLAAARPDDLALAARSVAIYNLQGQSQADALNSFSDVFGTELASKISPSEITFKLLGASSSVYIMTFETSEAAIKIISSLRTQLQLHTNGTDRRSLVGVGDFLEGSLAPVRRAMLSKASFLKQNFSWIKSVRIRFTRSTGRLHLTAHAIPELSQSLRDNRENHTVINLGSTFDQLSDPEKMNFRELRKPNTRKHPSQTSSAMASATPSADQSREPSRSSSPLHHFLAPPTLPPGPSTPRVDPTAVAQPTKKGGVRGRSGSRSGITPEHKRLAGARGGKSFPQNNPQAKSKI